MPNELDQISRLLGSIEAKQTTANAQLEAVFNKIDIMRKEHSELLGVVKEHTARLEMLENELAQDVVPHLQDLQRLKQRGIGILTVFGLLSAGVGIFVTKALKYIWP